MYITGLKMTFAHGSVSLLSKSKRLKVPESIEEVPVLLPPVLALTYNYARMIRKTVEYIDDTATSVDFGSSSEPNIFPPCFVPSSSFNKKKKSNI